MYDSRASGVLLAVSSLPGPYGIGSLGAPARRFVDFLADAGQTYWQILPLVPPGHGNSPYMSPSAFAGNPDLIDLDELVSMGLLTHQAVSYTHLPGDGAGMGLAIARHIVELHQGTLLLGERDGGGMLALVSLPTGPLRMDLAVHTPAPEAAGGISPVLMELADVLPLSLFHLEE